MELLAFEASELCDEAVSDVAWPASLPAGAHRRELEAAATVRTRRGRRRSFVDETDEPWRPVAGFPVDPFAVGR